MRTFLIKRQRYEELRGVNHELLGKLGETAIKRKELEAAVQSEKEIVAAVGRENNALRERTADLMARLDAERERNHELTLRLADLAAPKMVQVVPPPVEPVPSDEQRLREASEQTIINMAAEFERSGMSKQHAEAHARELADAAVRMYAM